MNTPADDIKDILLMESSLNLAFAENLFVGKIPAKPRRCVTILDSYGYPPQLAFTDQGYEYPSVQIIVRDVDYDVAYSISDDIVTLLHGMGNVPVNGALYTVIACSSPPTLLEWDDNGNVLFNMNFNMQRRAA